MAYFHPEETIFSTNRQEEHMLEALQVFADVYGRNGEPTAHIATELRGMWFGRDKEAMYNFLLPHIQL